MKILEFPVKDKYYAAKIDDITEIVVDMEITGIKNTNEYIKGVFEYRDKIYTVIDLIKMLTDDDKAIEKEHTIFLLYEKENRNIAFFIENIDTLREIKPDKIEKLNFLIKKNKNCYVESIVKYSKNHLIQILDIDSIVKQNYKNEITE